MLEEAELVSSGRVGRGSPLGAASVAHASRRASSIYGDGDAGCGRGRRHLVGAASGWCHFVGSRPGASGWPRRGGVPPVDRLRGPIGPANRRWAAVGARRDNPKFCK